MTVYNEPLFAAYPGIQASSNLVDFEIIEPNPEVFDFAKNKAYISHSLQITVNKPIVLNGNFMLAIKNVAPNARMALQISGLFTIRSEVKDWPPAKVAYEFLDFLFNYCSGYLLQEGINESVNVDFQIPANHFPHNYFDRYFAE